MLSPVRILAGGNNIYLNVNQSWEMWKDAAKHFKFLDVLSPDTTPFYSTVPIIVTLWFLLSLPFYVVLKWVVFRGAAKVKQA